MMDDITKINKVKEDMMELWKETFHDSAHYIDIVFENYFTPANAFYRYDENRLIASLLRIPYEFQILTNEGLKRLLRGVYLCGLATRPEYRRRGIMAELMNEAEEASNRSGYDLSFLIPADDHLRDYYKRKGYRTASWRKAEYHSVNLDTNTPNNSEDRNDITHTYSIQDFLKEKNRPFLAELADWCREIESSRQYNTIIHSQQDLIAIFSENENSIFLTNGTFDPEFPILTKVVAVILPELGDSPDKPLRVVGLYSKTNLNEIDQHNQISAFFQTKEGTEEIHRHVMQTLNNEFGKYNLPKSYEEDSIREETPISIEGTFIKHEICRAVLKHFDRSKMQLVLPYMGNELKERGVEPYAMIKPLKMERSGRGYENFKFSISLMLD